jgi:hypothetical protein
MKNLENRIHAVCDLDPICNTPPEHYIRPDLPSAAEVAREFACAVGTFIFGVGLIVTVLAMFGGI